MLERSHSLIDGDGNLEGAHSPEQLIHPGTPEYSAGDNQSTHEQMSGIFETGHQGDRLRFARETDPYSQQAEHQAGPDDERSQ